MSGPGYEEKPTVDADEAGPVVDARHPIDPEPLAPDLSVPQAGSTSSGGVVSGESYADPWVDDPKPAVSRRRAANLGAIGAGPRRPKRDDGEFAYDPLNWLGRPFQDRIDYAEEAEERDAFFQGGGASLPPPVRDSSLDPKCLTPEGERLELELYLRTMVMDTLISMEVTEDSRSYFIHDRESGRWIYVPWDLNNADLRWTPGSRVGGSADVTRPIPGSRKIHVEGSRPDIRVPMREVTLTKTPTMFGGEDNAPFAVYDCSGPYTDPDARIDSIYLHRGPGRHLARAGGALCNSSQRTARRQS